MSAEAKHSLPAGVRVFPNVWPGQPLEVQPGDVASFAGMAWESGAQPDPMPESDPEHARQEKRLARPEGNLFHPLHSAPLTSPYGGVIYFNACQPRETLMSAFDLMGVLMREDQREFAIFYSESETPSQDGYLAHCRIMPFDTLWTFYLASVDLVEGRRSPQPMSARDVILGFIAAETERWGTKVGGPLSGLWGGDGDDAQESLCFGFMVEDAWQGIYRVWSRAELVTS